MEPLPLVRRVPVVTALSSPVTTPTTALLEVPLDEPVDGDPHVVVQITHTDRNAEFAAFMLEAARPLHRMAYLLCGDQHRAEELTQHALERTYRSWSKAREGDPLIYARRVLANLRIDSWRRTRREVLTGPEDLPHSDAAERAAPGDRQARHVEERDAVVRALLLLPVRQRRVVVLRHLVGLSEAEVSDELSIPVGTVKSTSSRGLARLRTILDADTSGSAR